MKLSPVLIPREPRSCFCTPISDVHDAARLLDAAVSAHLRGRKDLAAELIRLANMPSIREWLESVWGKGSPFIKYHPVANPLPTYPKDRRVENRMPSIEEKKHIHTRDGFYCRFCNMPVIRKEVRVKLQQLHSDALPWGRTNDSQHSAFQAMWAQYDHIVPHARGGTNTLSNLVLTCAACNFGRMNYTLDEVAILDPRERDPHQGPWDGLERMLLAT